MDTRTIFSFEQTPLQKRSEYQSSTISDTNDKDQ